ncbi:ABC transporter permease [Halosimplex amylolyticum]|uniref:ABC transporter permease n=1 Tax=Halosimplex amylolyticum TaxID=3396616 RepID=UPI003F57B387
MSWRVIAGKDVRDAGRSKAIWLLFGLLAAVSWGYAYGHEYLGESTFAAFLDGLAGVVAVVLPVVAILLGYKSVVHERTSGSLFLSLSFPHSRRDVVVGTFVGRAVVLLAPTLVALAVAGGIGAVRYGTDGAAMYPWFLFASALYGLAFVGLAVGLSTATTVDRWITLGAFGGYLFVVTFWSGVNSLTLLILHRFDTTVLADIPDWALLLRLAGPSESFHRLVRAGFDVPRAARYVGEEAPLYVDWWAAIVLLIAWSLVPLAIGYYRFSAADL